MPETPKLTVREVGAATRELYPEQFKQHNLTDDEIGVAVRDLYPDKFSSVADVEPTTGLPESQVPGLPFTPSPAGTAPQPRVREIPMDAPPQAGRQAITPPVPQQPQPQDTGNVIDRSVASLVGADSVPAPPAPPGTLEGEGEEGIIGKGLSQGFGAVTVGAAGGGLQMLGEMIDSDILKDAGVEVGEWNEAVQKQAQMPEEIASDPFEDPSVMADPRWWAYTMSSGVGSMVPFLLSGTAAIKLLGRGGSLVQRYGPSGVAGTIEGMVEGSLAYKEARDNGKSPLEAAGIAAKTGATTAALSATGGKLGVFGDAAKSKGARLGASIGAESITEGLQEGFGNLYQDQPLHQGVIPGMVGGAFGGGLAASAIPGAGPTPETGAGPTPEQGVLPENTLSTDDQASSKALARFRPDLVPGLSQKDQAVDLAQQDPEEVVQALHDIGEAVDETERPAPHPKPSQTEGAAPKPSARPRLKSVVDPTTGETRVIDANRSPRSTAAIEQFDERTRSLEKEKEKEKLKTDMEAQKPAPAKERTRERFDKALQEVRQEQKPTQKEHLMFPVGGEAAVETKDAPKKKTAPEQRIPEPESITEADLPPSMREGATDEVRPDTQTEERVVPLKTEPVKEAPVTPIPGKPVAAPTRKTEKPTAKKAEKPVSDKVRKKDIKVGDVYLKRVGEKKGQRVEIVEELEDDKGWIGKNLETGRRVRVKSNRGLRREPSARLTETTAPVEGPKPKGSELTRKFNLGKKGPRTVEFDAKSDATLFDTASREVSRIRGKETKPTRPREELAKIAGVPKEKLQKHLHSYRKAVIERSREAEEGGTVGAPTFREHVAEQERVASVSPGAVTEIEDEQVGKLKVAINKDRSADVYVRQDKVHVPADQIDEYETPESIASKARKINIRKAAGVPEKTARQTTKEAAEVTDAPAPKPNQRVVQDKTVEFPDDITASVYDIGGVTDTGSDSMDAAMQVYNLDSRQMQDVADGYRAYVDKYIRDGGDPKNVADPEEALGFDIFKGDEAGFIRADALYPEWIQKKADRWSGAIKLRWKNLPKDNRRMWYRVHSPGYVAEVHREFRKLYRRAQKGDQESHTIIKEMRDLAKPFLDLPKAKRAELNERLIQGRLDRKRDIDLTGLDEQQVEAYRKVRILFDRAMEKIEGAAIYLATNGAIDTAESFNSASDIEKALLAGGMKPKEAKSLAKSTWKIIKDVRQSKKEGYVPFSRFGDWAVVLKKKDPVSGKWETIERRQAGSARDASDMAREIEKKYADQIKKNPDSYEGVKTYQIDKDSKMEGSGIGIKELENLFRAANLDTDLTQEVLEKMSPHIETRGFRSHFTQSKDIPGFEVDLSRSIADYSLGIANHVSTIKMLRDLNESKKYLPRQKKQLHQFTDRWIDYLKSPDDQYLRLRQMAFHWTLGGFINIRPAIDNATQVGLVAIPWLTQYESFGQVNKEITRAYKDVTVMLLEQHSLDYSKIDWSKLPDDVKDDLVKSVEGGTLRDSFTHDLAAIKSGGHGVIAKTEEASAYPFSSMEKINRLVTFIAAHRIHSKAKMKSKTKEQSQKKAKAKERMRKKTGFESSLEFADDIVNDTHFEYGKYNRAEFLRGRGGALFMYKSFPLNYAEVHLKLARRAMKGNKGAVMAFMYLLGAMTLVGGWEGIFGVEDALYAGSKLAHETPIFAEIFASVFGTTPYEKVDWADEIEKFIAELTSDKFSEVFRHGLGRLTPIDFGATIGQGRPIGLEQIIEYKDPTALFTIPSMGGRIVEGAGEIAKGDTRRGLPKVVPSVAAGPLRAKAMMDDPEKESGTFARTKYGGQIGLPGGTPPTGLEVFAQALNYTPTRKAQAYEKEKRVHDLADSTREVKANIVQNWARGIVEGDEEAVEEAKAARDKFNAEHGEDRQLRITLDNVRDKIEFMKKSPRARHMEKLPRHRRRFYDEQ